MLESLLAIVNSICINYFFNVNFPIGPNVLNIWLQIRDLTPRGIDQRLVPADFFAAERRNLICSGMPKCIKRRL